MRIMPCGDWFRNHERLGTETTLFIGAHYGVTNPGIGQTVTKYYFAGATRVAMRKYTIPQSMTVEYLLGDHLGSTSLTTDSTGAKVSEIRYKPWGEIRSTWTSQPATTPAYKLASYTFTGQFSYMDDPTTSGVTEGFGLLFYNARWYDPVTGRFAQADSILADPVQGWDRFAYVNNNPLAYTDPSGHQPCGDGEVVNCNGSTNLSTPPIDLGTSDNPDQADPLDVSEQSDPVQKLYALYRWMWDHKEGWWWTRYGRGGFTLWEFMSIFWGYEQSTYPNSSDYATSLGNHAPVYCLKAGCDSNSVEGALAFLADFTHATLAGHRGDCMTANACQLAFATAPIPSARESMDIVEGIYLGGPGSPGRHEPYDLGNVSMSPKIYKKMISLGMVSIVYGQNGQDKMIILTYCQAQMATYAAANGGAKAINLRTYRSFCGG
jgi:RHS repeat-associated protein